MSTIERVREIIEKSEMNKSQLARKLDVTPQYIYKLMREDTEPSERMILALIKEFPDISETWLRTGEGEMKKPKTQLSVALDISNRLEQADPSCNWIRLMELVAEMSEEQVNVFYDFAEKFVKRQ